MVKVSNILHSFIFIASLWKLVISTAECPYEACFYVKNNCGHPLWLERTDIDSTNGIPFNTTRLDDGNDIVLDISKWTSQNGERLYAWWADPVANPNLNQMTWRDKIEINICFLDPIRFCYNPTAVDYFGLPVTLGPYDYNDCPDTVPTGAPITLTNLKNECPTRFFETAPLGVCYSPGYACYLNESEPFCHDLDSTYDACVKDGNCAANQTTHNIFACNGWFATQPEWCAALNRGVYQMVVQDDFNQWDPSKFYPDGVPNSEYCEWIHATVDPYAHEYAFPFDDYFGEGSSGFSECVTDFMSVVFCPVG